MEFVPRARSASHKSYGINDYFYEGANVLSKGGTEDPMILYKKFRGQEPKIEALLEKRGMN